MLRGLLVVGVLAATSASVRAQDNTCKDPTVEKRLLYDDVRFASPFYVLALPRNPRTEQMDNVCYTYYENDDGGFFHVMSITYTNGTNSYYMYNKGDISNRMGLAEAKAVSDSQCVYHDYTLTPICNVTVFILYRCFIDGACGDIDIGITPGVDVRLVLAASPKASAECLKETETSLKDTSELAGGDYVILPQKRDPQCITKFNDRVSIGADKAIGKKKEVTDDVASRFGDVSTSEKAPTKTPAKPAPYPPMVDVTIRGPLNNVNNPSRYPTGGQAVPNRNNFNQYGYTMGSSAGSYASAQSFQTSPRPGYNAAGQTPAPAWTVGSNQWTTGPSPWTGQGRPGEVHYHTWQQQPAPVPDKKNANVFYHVHTWDSPPPGCCRCN